MNGGTHVSDSTWPFWLLWLGSWEGAEGPSRELLDSKSLWLLCERHRDTFECFVGRALPFEAVDWLDLQEDGLLLLAVEGGFEALWVLLGRLES